MCQTKIRAFHYFKNIARKNTFFTRMVTSHLKKCELTFSKFQAYLRDQMLNLAPVPFLYPYALSLYDLSNTGKDFIHTLFGQHLHEKVAFASTRCTKCNVLQHGSEQPLLRRALAGLRATAANHYVVQEPLNPLI
jgi:hypothetical protein